MTTKLHMIQDETKVGRPALSDEPTQRITITITTADLTFLDEISTNRSEGIRLALRTLRSQRTELKRISTQMDSDPATIVTQDELQRRLAEKKVTPNGMASRIQS